MIVDVDYNHYWIGDPDGAEVEPEGTGVAANALVCGGAVMVLAHTQWGPVSLRLLVGDRAPGRAEDAWRGDWETVTDVVLEATDDVTVRTWEHAPSDPPSGTVVRPGRWGLRFHARGRDKVDLVDGFPESPLEEHLVLLWPSGAAPGAAPVWDEVTGTAPAADPAASPDAVGTPWSLEHFGPGGTIKTPEGHYRLTSNPAGPQEPPTGDLEAEGGARLAGTETEVIVFTGTRRPPCEVWFDGHLEPQAPDSHTVGGRWEVVDEQVLRCARPVQIIDGTGAVPRWAPDPLLPAGNWHVRLLRQTGSESAGADRAPADDWVFGHRRTHRLQLWPEP